MLSPSLTLCGEEVLDGDLSASMSRRCIEDGAISSVAGQVRKDAQAWRLVCTCGCEHPHYSQRQGSEENRGMVAAAVLLGALALHAQP